MKLQLGTPRWLEIAFDTRAFRIAVKHLCAKENQPVRNRQPQAPPHHRHTCTFFELP